MKELTTEEKAQRYDEAIPQLKGLLDGIHEEKSEIMEEDITNIFPELLESEDERIRKELIAHCRNTRCVTEEGAERIVKWISWLEKHKYTEDDLDKAYKCADEVQYRRGYEDAKKEIEKQDEQPIYKTPSREIILAIWDLGNEWKELTNGSISTEYGTQLDYIQKHWEESEYYLRAKQGELFYAGVKAERDLNMPVWNEDDEKLFSRISGIIHNAAYQNYEVDVNGEEVGEYANIMRWFKSLKERVQPQVKQEWKPTDEQINTLFKYAEQNNKDGSILTSLYQELKKLMEE